MRDGAVRKATSLHQGTSSCLARARRRHAADLPRYRLLHGPVAAHPRSLLLFRLSLALLHTIVTRFPAIPRGGLAQRLGVCLPR